MPTELIIARLRRALLLDSTAFEEARDDPAFTAYAIGLAALAAFVGGFGSFLWSSVVLNDTDDFFVEATILGSIFLILLWIAGIFAAYFLLSQLYREDVLWDGLTRVMALAYVPFAVSLLVFIPQIGFGFGVLAIAAMFFYTNFGIRAAYPNIEPFRVMVAVLVAFAVWTMILPLLTSTDNAFAPGTFVFEWSADFADDFIGATSSFRVG